MALIKAVDGRLPTDRAFAEGSGVPDPRRIQATVDDVVREHPPCTVGSLIRAGISPGRIRAATAAGALTMARRGIVIPTALLKEAEPQARHDLGLRAALLAFPGSWASHDSAARLHGLPVRGATPSAEFVEHVHISRAELSIRERRLTVHGHAVPDEHVVHVGVRWGWVEAVRRPEIMIGRLQAALR